MCKEIASTGLKQAALSNACGAYVRRVLEVNSVPELFSVQLGADDVPAAKPEPDGLLLCCSKLGINPAEVRTPSGYIS